MTLLRTLSMAHIPQVKIPATYLRGGTSKVVFFRLSDLPERCQPLSPAATHGAPGERQAVRAGRYRASERPALAARTG